MLFIEAIESVRCFDEGVIESVADANIGSIMGIGYPPWTGGVLQYINGYARPRPHRLASSPAPASLRPATASASSRRPRWSSAPSAASPTATSPNWPPSDWALLYRAGQTGFGKRGVRLPGCKSSRSPRW